MVDPDVVTLLASVDIVVAVAFGFVVGGDVTTISVPLTGIVALGEVGVVDTVVDVGVVTAGAGGTGVVVIVVGGTGVGAGVAVAFVVVAGEVAKVVVVEVADVAEVDDASVV